MKGVIFNLLESLVIDRFGDEIMEEIYEQAEFSADAPPFIGPETYPDSDLIAIVSLLSEKSNLPVDDLIYEFGRYMLPVLADKYPVFFQDVESPIEFLKSVNDIIHVEVKKLFDGATPPLVTVANVNQNQAEIHYASERKLCRLLEGLLEGTAEHFDKNISYHHKQCMKDGFDDCILNIEFNEPVPR